VLLTIEHTALASPVRRAEVPAQLDRTVTGERAFAFSLEFLDAWFDLVNAEQSGTPMTVEFETRRADFPPNLDPVEPVKISLAYFLAAGTTVRATDLSTELRLTDAAGQQVGGPTEPIDGLISTSTAPAWQSLLTRPPIGRWRMALRDTADTRALFATGTVTDVLLVITFRGATPPWPG
jgi:hypothetical protein